MAFWFWDGVYQNLELEGVVLCSNSGMGGVKHGTLLNSVGVVWHSLLLMRVEAFAFKNIT